MRYVTGEQRSRRTLFKPTPWAVASWLIFRVAHSLRIDSDMLVVRALKISQLTDGGLGKDYGNWRRKLRCSEIRVFIVLKGKITRLNVPLWTSYITKNSRRSQDGPPM